MIADEIARDFRWRLHNLRKHLPKHEQQAAVRALLDERAAAFRALRDRKVREGTASERARRQLTPPPSNNC